MLSRRLLPIWARYKHVVRPTSILFVIWAAFSLMVPIFTSAGNITNIMRNSAVSGIAGIGLCVVVICGDMDLSIGSTMSLCGVITAMAITHWGMHPLAAILIALLCGVCIGICNGAIVTFFRIHSLITTFLTMNILQGITYKISGGQAIAGMPSHFYEIGHADFLHIPVIFLIMLGMGLLMNWVLANSYWGKFIYAVGSSRETAQYAGINTKATRIVAFAICGLLAALAGVLLCWRLNYGLSIAGRNFEFKALVVVALSGVSLKGGTGAVYTAIIGALTYTTIDIGLIMVQASTYDQFIVQGLIVLIALVFDSYVPRLRPAPEPERNPRNAAEE